MFPRLILSIAIVTLLAGCANNQAKSGPTKSSQSFSSFGPPSFGGSPGGSSFHANPGSLGQPTNFGASGFNPVAMPSSWRSYTPTK